MEDQLGDSRRQHTIPVQLLGIVCGPNSWLGVKLGGGELVKMKVDVEWQLGSLLWFVD